MRKLPPLPELCRRVDRAEADCWRIGVETARLRGVFVKSFSGPIGFITRGHKNTLFNRVLAIGPGDADKIGAIVSWYKRHKVPPRFDVCPALKSAELAGELRALGFRPAGMRYWGKRVLAGVPKTKYREVKGVSVRGVAFGDLNEFVAIQAEIWRMTERERKQRLVKAQATHGLPGLRRYFACIGGVPVAVAQLHVVDGTGMLNLGATRKSFRRKGCQTALLRQRIRDAAEAGCGLVASLTSANSASQRNIERAGLKVICDRELWVLPDWHTHPFYSP